MTWRVAQSLETLRKQLNNAFPNRSKASDGSIGDAAHSNRTSDHNPDANGVVKARDFTHDPKGGLDCNWLANALVSSRDRRIKYIIWNKRILSSKQSAWQWRPYTGTNAHSHHLHLSVNAEKQFYDDARVWDLDIAQTKPEAQPKTGYELKLGDKGELVKGLQTALVQLGYLAPSEVDGYFGMTTKNAVIAFQISYVLDPDGIVGVNTRSVIARKLEQLKNKPAPPLVNTNILKPTPKQANVLTDGMKAQLEGNKIDSEQMPADTNASLPINQDTPNPQNASVPNQDNKEKIFVPKPVKKSFWERMWAKITGATSGNLTVQALTDNAQQAGALGLSPRFWTIAVIGIFVATIIYLIYEWHKSRQDDAKQMAITDLLVKENSTPNNIVELIEPDMVDLYKTKGKVISR